MADGTVVSVQAVGYGLDAVEPTIPEKAGYTARWDADGKNITADTTITAVYTAVPTTDAPESDGPATGDQSQILLLSMMAIGSMLALVLLFLRGKREYMK